MLQARKLKEISKESHKDHKRIIPGSRVRVRGEEWKVLQKRYFNPSDPNKSEFEVEAEGQTGIVVGHKAIFISNIDAIEIIEPHQINLVQDSSKRFAHTKLYLESMLRKLPIRKKSETEKAKIRVGHKGAFDHYPYQMEPTVKALSSLRPKILIGDGVGLGKTIEIGIMLSELIKRGKGRRILIVTPKAILQQFQKEMFGRFGIALTRLDSNGIASLNRMLPSTMNPFMFHDRVIISMDTLKSRRYLNALQKCSWDTVVIDECHNVSVKGGNTKNQRARLARVLCEKAEAVVLSSATPHDGTKEGFASLIQLLDPTLIKDEQNYGASDIASVFIRRTKEHVKDQIRHNMKGDTSRSNNMKHFSLSNTETEVLEQIHKLVLDEDNKLIETRKKGLKGRGFKELFRTTLKKAYLSSPDALIETLDNKLKRSKTINKSDKEKLEKIKKLAEKTQNDKFTKYQEFKSFLKEEVTTKKRVVVFTERIATLNFLKEQLVKDKLYKKDEVEFMNGSMGDAEAQEVANKFQSKNSKVKVLIATNMASEGLNLHQQCHHLVHFDLPWSFITLEQRNGRIDRLGQEHRPFFYYMCANSDSDIVKADLHIIDKLKGRIESAGECMDDKSLQEGFLTAEQEEIAFTQQMEQTELDLQTESEENDEFVWMSEEELSAVQIGNNIEEYIDELESFFENDQQFVKACLEELDIQHKESGSKITIEDMSSLKHELEHLPTEVIGQDKVRLEFDKKKMMTEIKKAEENNEWVASHFATDANPIVELFKSKSTDLFHGADTPIVFYKGQASEHKLSFLMQGQLYNKHGQVIFEEWAICSFNNIQGNNMDLYGPIPIAELKDWTGLTQSKLVNPQEELPKAMKQGIEEKLTLACTWMEDVMDGKRTERGDKFRYQIKKERKRLREWADQRAEALKKKIDLSKKDSKSVPIHLQRELKRIERIKEQYDSWVFDHFDVDKNAVIKILGVFINAGKK
jgi:SNF2 family DNA or RNA helicase